MHTPTLDSIDPKDKRIIVRGDLDVLKDGKIDETARLEALMSTLSWLIEKGAKNIFLIGHAGRPEGKLVEELSLKPLVQFFAEKLSTEVEFVEHVPFDLYYEIQEKILGSQKKIILLENLRFWPQEEANDKTFAQQLAYGQDFFVNDAFASSHREHASIVGIPTLIPAAAGVQFAQEVENLSKVKENPKSPVIAIISGLKKDKLDYLEDFKKFCDKILLGGRLPEFMPEDTVDAQLIIAKLNPDKEDITIKSIEMFESEIEQAGTIILAGPIGKYEEEGHKLGTKRVFEAVAKSSAFKIACGGDTTAAMKLLGIEGFDFISLAGGASLEFLAKGILPGIEALTSARN